MKVLDLEDIEEKHRELKRLDIQEKFRELKELKRHGVDVSKQIKYPYMLEKGISPEKIKGLSKLVKLGLVSGKTKQLCLLANKFSRFQDIDKEINEMKEKLSSISTLQRVAEKSKNSIKEKNLKVLEDQTNLYKKELNKLINKKEILEKDIVKKCLV